MPPIFLAAGGAGGGSSRYAERSRTKDAEIQLRKIERWRRNPNHHNLRWAHLVGPDQEEEDNAGGELEAQQHTSGDGEEAAKKEISSPQPAEGVSCSEDSEYSESLEKLDFTPLIQSTEYAGSSVRQTPSQNISTGAAEEIAQEDNPAFSPPAAPQSFQNESNGSNAAGMKTESSLSHSKLKIEQQQLVPQQKGGAAELFTYWTSPEGKAQITLFFDDPTSSVWAYRASIIVLLTIFVSVVAICLETMPELQHGTCCKDAAKAVFTVVEVLCIIIFSLEYGIRFAASLDKCKFVWGPMNVIDLLAILPFYVEMVFPEASDLDILKMFRLVRVFRVFKLSKSNKNIQITLLTLYQCRALFALMVAVMLGIAIFFGSFGYQFEKNIEGTPFRSMLDAMWWITVSVNMVGYGEIFPVTEGGKLVGGIAIGFGIGLLALPISVIGNTFSEAWDRLKLEEKLALSANWSPAQREAGLKRSLKTVTLNLERFNQLCADNMNYSRLSYSDTLPAVSKLWKSFSRFNRQLFSERSSDGAAQSVRGRFLTSVSKFEVYELSIRNWEKYADDHPKYGKYREFNRALNLMHEAKYLTKYSQKVLKKCSELGSLGPKTAIEPEIPPDKSDSEPDNQHQGSYGAKPHEEELSVQADGVNPTAGAGESLHTSEMQTAELDDELASSMGVDAVLMQRYFNRYDLDDSGTINNLEELTQLCTNLIVKLGLGMSLGQLERLTSKIENLEAHPWSFEYFRDWFLEKLRECQDSNPDRALNI